MTIDRNTTSLPRRLLVGLAVPVLGFACASDSRDSVPEGVDSGIGDSGAEVVDASDADAAITYGSLVDARDGQTYRTIVIGTQTWMADNLNVGVYAESHVQGYAHSDVSDNGIIEKYAAYDDEANLEIYGGLYDWNEAMGYETGEGIRGICPEGWHLPTDADWSTLEDAVGGSAVAGSALGVGGTSGFDAQLGGWRDEDGDFGFAAVGRYGYYWSTSPSEDSAQRMMRREFRARRDDVTRGHAFVTSGFSVRCIEDEPGR